MQILRGEGISQLWQDECLAAVLRSDRAETFISVNRNDLLSDKGRLLFSAMHLCRIVATEPNPKLGKVLTFLSETRVPIGLAWSAIVNVLAENIGLIEENTTLVANFVEDWSRRITEDAPYPEGSESVAKICFSQAKQAISPNDSFRFLKVLAKIPKAGGNEFVELVRRDSRLPSLIIGGLNSSAVCRDYPDLVIECLKKYLGPIQAPRPNPYRFRFELEELFGMRRGKDLGNSSASAWQGPFLNLLLYHPDKGLPLIIEIVNQSVLVFSDEDLPREYVEFPEPYQLELSNGTTKNIWGSWRLWGAFRGITVVPYDLQSALMALESWLLLKSQAGDSDLEKTLLDILAQTNNVSLVAVVASVVCAAPNAAGQAAYTVLTVPEFFDWDLLRKQQEQLPVEEMLSRFIPNANTEEEVYGAERTAARSQPHRSKTLEDLCRELQNTPLKDKVFKLLDRFRQLAVERGPEEDENVVWLNIINRMDLRGYRQVSALSDGTKVMQSGPLPEPFDERLKAAQPLVQASNRILSLLNWGVMAFKRQLKVPEELERWREMLPLVQREVESFETDDESTERFLNSAATHIAAVAVRDHLGELTDEKRRWCGDVFSRSIAKEADLFDDFNSSQVHEIDASRPSAFAISFLAAVDDSEEVQRALSIALTHSNDQVRMYAIAGFRQVFSNDATMQEQVLSAFVASAVEFSEAIERDRTKPFIQRKVHNLLVSETLLRLRERIFKRESFDLALAPALSIQDEASYKFLPILSDWLSTMTSHSAANEFFNQNVFRLSELYSDESQDSLFFSKWIIPFEHALARFLLNEPRSESSATVAPLLNVVKQEPEKCAHFFFKLIEMADHYGKKDSFWPIWEQFSRVLKGEEVEELVRNDGFIELIRGLFLIVDLKEGVKVLPLLNGEERRVIDLFCCLPLSRAILGLFLQLVLTVGRESLELSLRVISARVTKANPLVLSIRNLGFLETILGPPIYSTPERLKKDPKVRDAVLDLLDYMVRAGSASAYFMRNDFATPLPPN